MFQVFETGLRTPNGRLVLNRRIRLGQWHPQSLRFFFLPVVHALAIFHGRGLSTGKKTHVNYVHCVETNSNNNAMLEPSIFQSPANRQPGT